MRDIHPFRSRQTLCRQTLRTVCRNMSLDKRIQSPQFINEMREAILITRRAASVVLAVSSSCGHLKKEYPSMQVGDVHLNFMESGRKPVGMVAVIVSSVSGVLSSILWPVMLSEAGHPRDTDHAR